MSKKFHYIIYVFVGDKQKLATRSYLDVIGGSSCYSLSTLQASLSRAYNLELNLQSRYYCI